MKSKLDELRNTQLYVMGKIGEIQSQLSRDDLSTAEMRKLRREFKTHDDAYWELDRQIKELEKLKARKRTGKKKN